MHRLTTPLLLLLSGLALAACTPADEQDAKSTEDGGGSDDGGTDAGGDDSGHDGSDDGGDDGGGDGGDDGGGDDGDDGGGDEGGDDGEDGGGGDEGGDDGSTIEIEELVFASPTVVIDDYLPSERVFVGDPNGDGHVDILASEMDMRISWYAGDGAGGFTEQDTTALEDALTALADAGELAMEFNEGGSRTFVSLSAMPTAGGDRLLASVQLNDGITREWGLAMGLLVPDGSGGWSATLLHTTGGWGGLVPLADIDGNGIGEVLVDAGSSLVLYWDGDAGQRELLGTVTNESVYPAAWTTTVDGSELGFVIGNNFGFGYTESWTWTPTRGLEQVAEGIYTTRCSAEVRMGFEAHHIWLHDTESVLRFTPGTPASFSESNPAAAEDSLMVTGNFDGSGRLTAVMEGDTALRVAEDGTLEELVLTIEDLHFNSTAVDIDGDGLDDLLRPNGSNGVEWSHNISAL